MKKIVRLTESDIVRLTKKIIKEQHDDNHVGDRHIAKDLSRAIMTSISYYGREKTSHLLEVAAEMIASSANTDNPDSPGYGYKIVDLKSDIEDWLSTEFD